MVVESLGRVVTAILGLTTLVVTLAGMAMADSPSFRGGMNGSGDGVVVRGLSASELQQLGSRMRGAVGAPATGPWVDEPPRGC